MFRLIVVTALGKPWGKLEDFEVSITEQRKRKGVCTGGRNVGSVNLYYVIREVFLQEGFEFSFNFVFFFY